MSLTLTEARARAADLSEVSYAVHLDLREPGRGDFGSRTTARFTTASGSTFLELTGASELRLTVDGAAREPAYDGVRLHLDLPPGPHEVVVDARLPLVTDGDGMHVVTDPADGATYVSAYLGMDVAQKVFCCADQNDVKAPLTLTVDADPAATVLANGRATRDGHDAGDGRWEFATTPPLPTAMVVVCAGPWHSRTWTHAGLPFGWHARASLAADLDRDFDELRATTEACFDHYATLFDEPYAFDSYDQAFVPGQNWGALETPGCVTYRDELLPRGRTTEVQRGARTTTIAHEMAHMWFGDLVTMTWWEDTWLQESFADYMGYRVAADACGRTDAPLRREVQRKVTGYDADRRRSTHPVAPRPEDVPDVDAAAGNFDMISYAKGNAALHQLVVWLGDAAFLRGVNAYLSRHRFGNATLDDLVTALDDASDRDVRAWAQAWLRTSGHDTLRVDGGALVSDGTRPHRVGVAALEPPTGRVVERTVVDVPAELPSWAGLAVVPNAGGETFARLDLDDATWSTVARHLLAVDDPLLRAVLWSTAATRVQTRTDPAAAHVALVADQLPTEPHWLLVDAVLTRTLGRVLPLRVAADDVVEVERTLAAACADGLARAGDDPDLLAAWASGLAATTDDPGLLRGWLDGGAPLALTPTLRWAVVRRLAELGAAEAEVVEDERRRDGSVQGDLGAARALAARPTAAAKEQAWAEVAAPDVGNRRFEAVTAGLFTPRHADLVRPFVARYLAEAPGWAARGQAFARTVGRAFPAVPLDTGQVDALRAALAGDVPPVLARQWADHLDDLA
ncbi:aminopeptidase N [Rhodococcus aerolatus]